jgi:hypothetical protein
VLAEVAVDDGEEVRIWLVMFRGLVEATLVSTLRAARFEINHRKSNGGSRRQAGRGAGRKAGTANKRTREVADRAAADGITPLEVMIETMRAHLAQGQLDKAARWRRTPRPTCTPD